MVYFIFYIPIKYKFFGRILFCISMFKILKQNKIYIEYLRPTLLRINLLIVLKKYSFVFLCTILLTMSFIIYTLYVFKY